MVKKTKRSKVTIREDSDSDNGGGNDDGFAVMENEVYDEEPVDPEAEKLAAAERKKTKRLE